MIKRMVVLMVMLGMALVYAVPPALAKMPPFELDVFVEDGVALVSVRVLGIRGSSLPHEGFDPADLDGLLAVYPSGDLDDQGRPVSHENALPVDLEWIGEPGLYEGRVNLGASGSWAVVPFPTVIGFVWDSAIHGYPGTFGFDVPARDSSVLAIGGGILIVIMVGIVSVVRRARAESDLRAQATGSMRLQLS